MKAWSELVREGLLGTRRLPDPAAAAEHALLSQAAAVALYQQVGRLPRRGPRSALFAARPAPAPAAAAPASPAASHFLAAMLAGHFADLLPEFLAALAAANREIPPAHLPSLLDRGGRQATLRPALLPVLGEHGRWLAAQNPAWAYAAPLSWPALRRLWRDENMTRRYGLLLQWRYTDPGLGRRLLESTWKEENEQSRVRAMRALATGLSLADEPFLERALDDRVYSVRRQAADLLARLPQSRLSRRLAASAGHFLSWSGRPAESLAVHFPAEIEPHLWRDGLPRHQTGDVARTRSRQLVHLVGAVPLSHWTELWPAGPAAILQAAGRSRWPRTLVRGLAAAARRQGDAPWAAALLRHDAYSPATAVLVELLPLPQFEALLPQVGAAILAGQPLDRDNPLLRLLRHWPHPWGEEMTRLWLDTFSRQARPDPQRPAGMLLRLLFKQLARQCPPEMAAEIQASLESYATDRSAWTKPMRDALAVVSFRHAMLAALDGAA